MLASASLGNGQGYTHTETEEGFVLRFLGTAQFVLDRDCRVVEAAVAPGIAADYIPILFSGNVLSFILTIRGEAVLHASAVDIGGEALAFVGASGMGKSTMAAVLCAGGARLITDDVLRLDLKDIGVGCHAGLPELRLRQAAAGLSEQFPSTVCRQTADGRLALRLPPPNDNVIPLRAIVIPKPSRDFPDLRCSKLSPLQAFLALTRYPRVLGWIGKEQLRRQVQWLGQVANRVPIFEAQIPWGPPFPVDLAKQLYQEIRDASLQPSGGPV